MTGAHIQTFKAQWSAVVDSEGKIEFDFACFFFALANSENRWKWPNRFVTDDDASFAVDAAKGFAWPRYVPDWTTGSIATHHCYAIFAVDATTIGVRCPQS